MHLSHLLEDSLGSSEWLVVLLVIVTKELNRYIQHDVHSLGESLFCCVINFYKMVRGYTSCSFISLSPSLMYCLLSSVCVPHDIFLWVFFLTDGLFVTRDYAVRFVMCCMGVKCYECIWQPMAVRSFWTNVFWVEDIFDTPYKNLFYQTCCRKSFIKRSLLYLDSDWSSRVTWFNYLFISFIL